MKNVLIVEDESSLQKAISIKLESYGLKTFLANSVDSGLDFLNNNKIDLIWLDHYLVGEKNGLELIREISKSKKQTQIPTILVSNTCTPEKYQTYMDLGVVKYFVKSDNSLDSIINEVQNLLSLEQA